MKIRKEKQDETKAEPDCLQQSKKKKIVVSILMIATLTVIVSAVFFYRYKTNIMTGETTPEVMNPFGENVISASGTTSIGMVEEEFEVENLDTDLYIEEVYLSSGDEVESGANILKISDDSLAAAKRELENEASQTELEYRQAVVTTQQEELDTKSTYDKALIDGNYAQSTYDASMVEINSEISTLQDQIVEAEDLVAEYTDGINNNTYYTYYKVDEIMKQYNENFELLMKLYDEWNISDSSSSSAGGTTSTGTTASTGTSKTSNNVSSVYTLFDAEVTEEGEEYENAKDNYELALETAKASITQAQTNLDLLKVELQESQVEYEKQNVTNLATRDIGVAEGQVAEDTYNTAIKKIEDELDTYKSAQDDAADNLEIFESTIGDGYLHTQSAGTIVAVTVRDGENLTSDSMVIAYSDPATITVEANVDQASIASLVVGDSAYVMISDEGNYEGVITAINPVTESTSRSSVYYTVTISLDGDISKLSANLTATVYFGMDLSNMSETTTNGGAAK